MGKIRPESVGNGFVVDRRVVKRKLKKKQIIVRRWILDQKDQFQFDGFTTRLDKRTTEMWVMMKKKFVTTG